MRPESETPARIRTRPTFLNDLARTGETADSSGNAPSGGNNPTTYENNIANIFNNIITNPKLRLVK